MTKLFEPAVIIPLAASDVDALESRWEQKPVPLSVPLYEEPSRIIYVKEREKDNTALVLGLFFGLVGLFGFLAFLARGK